MKKILPLLALALAGAVGTAQAQTSASSPATVNATVKASLTLATVGETNFWIVTAGTGVHTLNPRAPGANQTAARFDAGGEPNANVLVTFSPVLLASPSGSLNFTPDLAWNPTFDQASAASIASGSPVTINASGQAWFWLGGNLDAPAGQPSGLYTGTFTVSLEYM